MIHVVKPPFALSSPDDKCRHPEAETQQRVRRGGVTKALLSGIQGLSCFWRVLLPPTHFIIIIIVFRLPSFFACDDGWHLHWHCSTAGWVAWQPTTTETIWSKFMHTQYNLLLSVNLWDSLLFPTNHNFVVSLCTRYGRLRQYHARIYSPPAFLRYQPRQRPQQQWVNKSVTQLDDSSWQKGTYS